MAPQLATVDVALNAFYGRPMLSPTTSSLQKPKTKVISESKANYVLERTLCKLNYTEQGIQNVYIKVSKH